MFRKFLITRLLVFAMHGEPGQLAAAASCPGGCCGQGWLLRPAAHNRIAKGDASEHSELQPFPLPAALDMRIDKSTRSAREAVLLLPDRLPAQEMVL